ncbi:MFS transporter [Paenibacillus sp. GYB003]|uniref:MFS transporter n=1 Tax=Paenibacillus sp. GYB003 TaxID=2994392 RepID=UPI002F9629AE
MERLWTKPFVQTTVVALFLFASLYLLLPTLPLFIKRLGGSEAEVGLAAGVFTLTAVVFRPVVGGLLDRYGRRPFLLAGLLVFAVSMALYDWIAGVAVLLALRVLHGAGWAFSSTAVGTAITDVIPASRRGEGMGWFGMAMTLAMAVGPTLGIWAMERLTFSGLFALAAVLAAAALLLALRLNVPFQPNRAPGGGWRALLDKSALPVTATVFFLAFVYGGITAFTPLFAESVGANPATFFLVYAIALTAIRPVAGKLSDRYGTSVVIVPALVVTASALLVLAAAGGTAGIVAAAVLYGIGFGAAQPALQAANLLLAHPERRGAATASFMTAFDLGIGIGSIGLGSVSQYAGYPALFATGAGSVVVSFVIFIVFARKALAASRAVRQSAPLQ